MLKPWFGCFTLLFLNTLYAQEDCLDFHVIKNAPIGYLTEDTEPKGVHWEYLKAIEDQTGYCINKTLLPYPRIWHSIKMGEHDGGIVFKSSSRSELVEYAALIRRVKTVVIPVKGTTIKNYDDLSKIIIGKTRGTHLSEKFDSDKSLKVIELNNYQQATQMLKHGRIDAIAGSALVLSFQLKTHDAIKHVDTTNRLVLGEKEQWLQLSKKSEHLDKIPEIKKAVGILNKNGSFEEIMNKYYGHDWKDLNQ